MRLANKVAVVTGSASGFGAAIARRFAQEGAVVVLADLDARQADAVAREIRAGGGQAEPCRCNVAVEADVRGAVQLAIDLFGGLHIVVNNAGTTHRNQGALAVPEGDFDRVMNVNVKSLYWSAQCALPHFRTQGGGVLVNIASATGVRPAPGLTWYSASKAAMISVTKALAQEFGKDGIRVNAINPMLGETGLLQEFMGMADTPDNRRAFLARIPLGRLTRPSDVANAALFLASDEAEFITGVSLDVDGGRNA